MTCVGCTSMLMAIAFSELRRIEDGRLFAFSLPWETSPSNVEVLDAKMSAKYYLAPVLASLAMLGTVVGLAGPRFIRRRTELTRWWSSFAIVFLFSVLADLATTVWFFHASGIDHELNPGIRLFGYAYGRTVGPLLGKAVQAGGVIGISICVPRFGWILLLVATLLYSFGAVYNISRM